MSRVRPGKRTVPVRLLTADAEEIRGEAKRLARSVSQVARIAWVLARDQVRAMPSQKEAVELLSQGPHT